jgi:hypothetical protein
MICKHDIVNPTICEMEISVSDMVPTPEVHVASD